MADGKVIIDYGDGQVEVHELTNTIVIAPLLGMPRELEIMQRVDQIFSRLDKKEIDRIIHWLRTRYL